MQMLISELCKVLGNQGFPASFEGKDQNIESVNTLEQAGPGEVTFLSNPKYRSAVENTQASAIIVKNGIDVPEGVVAIRCTDPYAAITIAIITLHGYRKHPQWGIHERATVDPTAKIGDEVNIGPEATIARDVQIGDRCTIYPGCYVADGARLGKDCILYPNVVIYDHCLLGDRVTVHAGSVIGEDGLGYVPHQDQWIKIPQIGRTVLGNDVEIGANCAVDRATLGRTEIGVGTKFGNEVVVGHGTKIGTHCMLVGQVGLAGSSTVGNHVTMAGQVGVAGHLIIGDDVQVGAQAGIMNDIPPKTQVIGSPAMPAGQTKRILLASRKLPELAKRVNELEEQVKELIERLNGRKDQTESVEVNREEG